MMRIGVICRSVARRALVVLAAAVVAAAAASAGPAFAQDRDPLVDTVAGGKGRINYGAGVVKATGYGAPPSRAESGAQARLMARGAAIADALRTLAMTVSSVQVTATTKVRNYQLESDEVSTQLSALLQSPEIVAEGVQADGTAYVTVSLPLYGKESVAAAVLPQVLPQAGPENASGARPSTAFAGPPGGAVRITPPVVRRPPTTLPGGDPRPTPLSDPGPFTSVIIDCRGLNIEAIMSPKLYDTTGREVYGTVRVSPEYAIETGIVGYPRSMAEAVTGARAGSHPLIVKAIRAADRARFHPVISLEDADRILAANNRDKFLERTAVIFVVDPVK